MRPAIIGLATLLALPARADDLDTQLHRPSFSPHGFLTHPGAKVIERPLSVGAVLQIEHAPMTSDGEDREVVPLRGSIHLGAHAIFSDLAVSLSIPAYASASGREVELTSPALGDAWAALTWRVLDVGPLTVAVDAALALPTGSPGALVGEGTLRGGPGLSAELALGPLSLMTACSLLLRSTVDTGHALVIGPEALFTVAAALGVADAPLRGIVELRARRSFGPFGLGTDPLSIDAGLRGRPSDEVALAATIGTALNSGYGGADLRATLGLVITLEAPGSKRPAPPKEPRRPTMTELLRLPAELESAASTSTIVDATALERCPRLGDPVRFALDSAELDDAARETIARAAERLRHDRSILHLVIEGRASSEGTARDNWRLSQRRAERVFVSLVEAGVPPSRLSIRGAGERSPEPADRKVELCIARRDVTLEDEEPHRVPWGEETGER